MRVLYPGRIVSRNVGGNTTYGRAVMAGVQRAGLSTAEIPAGENPLSTLIKENAARYRRQVPADLIHYLADTGSLIGGGTPSVVTVHGIASRWIDGVRSPLKEYVWRSRVHRAISTSVAVVTPSKSSACDIAEVFDVPIERIAVIPHGIEHMTLNGVLQPLSEEVRNRIPAEFLLYVGNIEPRKNLEALIAAMDEPGVRSLGLKLVIAGKPAWNYDMTMAAIKSSSHVIYLGFVSDSDRNALMKACTAFVFPSRYEGFGFPVLEALSAGRPVITSDRGSLAEVAGPSWISEDLSSEGIGDSIASALNDSGWLAHCVEEGPRWVTRFSWEVSIKSHLDVYRKVCGQ
ncbi:MULTISPECIES: glycosyltransferase family 4 protein [unclassified Rhodococcus (in: high G+C Gram-positive bacteria)]|uniref:glycosyltransferase family 4 protein n=1 Tax=unclassified Rhodococcus (in: high G+C Gram-positive bacteria) TaxID=192944 RepID=UPI000AC1A7E3|nr:MULTISPECIES: glycosyltransferase family 1 protein [unclassified Rhodococcus (in: high G+C Gram-positive bacteria)]